MDDVTLLVHAAANGDHLAADQLLPLIYDELRRLAAHRLSQERPGHTLQATALVHQAYLRLVGEDQEWNGRGHFFAAAAEAMRRILVDHARSRQAEKRGAGLHRIDLQDDVEDARRPREDLTVLDDALTKLESADPRAASVVKLRYFAGLNMAETAAALNLSERSAGRIWAYAKAFLRRELAECGPAD